MSLRAGLQRLLGFINRPPMNAPQHPVIAVIGATGTGKSRLAVDLAIQYNGEIINADAMQMYAGLPIITNKIPTEEQNGVKHHLLGHVKTSEAAWRVDTFVTAASQIINELHLAGKVPILVGGTHYYLQKLLFRDTLASQVDQSDQRGKGVSSEGQKMLSAEHSARLSILDSPTPVILEELRRVDPTMANRWHPNDRRKIQRSLGIYLQTGQKASDIYAEQARAANEQEQRLNWPTLFLWPHSVTTVLNDRLDHRVQGMLDAGLVQEVASLESQRRQYQEQHIPVDETSGIWASIGYKEFKAYHDMLHSDVEPQKRQRAYSEAVERTMISTRQYARSQIRWIKMKLVKALRQASYLNHLFVLDTSSPEHWQQHVAEPATRLVDTFLAGQTLPDPSTQHSLASELLTSTKGEVDETGSFVVQTCELCDVTAATSKSWEAHLSSNRHRARRKAVAKRENEKLLDPD